MRKTEKQKVNSIIENLQLALRIMILNSMDSFTINLLETKIEKYQIILKGIK